MKKGKNERRITLGQQIIVAMLIMQSAVMAFLSGMVVAGITKNTRAEAIDKILGSKALKLSSLLSH